jgi:hypothetical protein
MELDPSHIMHLGTGFWASKTVLSAVELQLFRHLGGESITSEESGEPLDLHPGHARAVTLPGKRSKPPYRVVPRLHLATGSPPGRASNERGVVSTRKALTIGAAAALVVPAIALAEVGPHSTWYAVHKATNGRQNNINIVYQRNNGSADVNGVNYCLGSSTPPGSTTAYPNSFDAYPVRVKHGKIAFQGKATVYIGMKKTRPRMNFSATLKPKKAVGQLSFPGTKCGTIHFTAPVALVKK